MTTSVENFGPDAERDVGFDNDGTFVETTNKRAAEVLAAHYGKQGIADYAVQSREVDGKTVYRIRPRSRPCSPSRSTFTEPAAASSAVTTPSIAITASASPRRPLRASRSIPLLRSAKNDPNPIDESLLQPTRTLRRVGSTPLLLSEGRAPGAKVARSRRMASDEEGDVLGRILGWGAPSVEVVRSVGDAVDESTPRKQSLRRAGASSEDPYLGPSQSHTPSRPTLARTASSPFGAGVRVPATWQLSDSPSPTKLAQPAHTMREVSSSDSIRTTMADDHQRGVPLPPRPRYQDPSVFDVIQGLDRQASQGTRDDHARLPSSSSVSSSLSDLSRATAHKITLSAAPEDDVRFALWGYKDSAKSSAPLFDTGERSVAEMDLNPPHSAGGSPATSSSTRWSINNRSSPATSIRESVNSLGASSPRPPQRILLAATVERLIAELTSQISTELLINFFLTFRSFLRPIDLLHSLTTRFDWAMQPPADPEDDASRRIVRVRTFVVLRHWLLNHFTDDFLPDRDLRSTLCDWLNQSARKPAFRESAKDQRLIKGLKKLVRKLKESHITLRIEQAQTRDLPSQADDDVDLELEHRSGMRVQLSQPSSHSRATFFRRGSVAIQDNSDDEDDSAQARLAAPLPMSSDTQNPIARSLSSAVNKVGRFKRKLGHRKSHANGLESKQSDALLDDEKSDLLRVEGGLDLYLESIGIKRESEDSAEARREVSTAVERNLQDSQKMSDALVEMAEDDAAPSIVIDAPISQASGHPFSRPLDRKPAVDARPVIPIFEPEMDTYDAPSSYARPDSVRIELDDIDLSDEDEDVTEVKKTLKRLPGATNLRLMSDSRTRPTYRSFDSMSSVGALRAPSFAAPERDTVLYLDEETGYEGQQGMQIVAGFILDGIDSSDEDEPGDVEAALRRLEGTVDDSKQRERARKVERQMAKSAKILGHKQGDGASMSADGDRSSVATSSAASEATSPSRTSLAHSSIDEREEQEASEEDAVATALELAPAQAKPVHNPTAAPTPRRAPMAHKRSLNNLLDAFTSRGKAARPKTNTAILAAPRPTGGPAPPTHRSFILFCRTEVLARQFCLIERDLLRAVEWRQLVGARGDIHAPYEEVLDWEAYLKEQRRAHVAAQKTGGEPQRSSAVQVLVARFNLTANWVCSEIVLTANLDERAVLIAKFIRLAFKSYCQSNFQTMAQIVHGLQLPDVERLKRTWAKVPSWEMRKYRSMQTFVSPNRNFKYLRDATSAILAERGPVSSPPNATSSSKAGHPAATGCIPFFGLFLRDLAVNSELSTFLDPTSTGAPASVDDDGALSSVADPSAFDDMAPLPYTTPLRPLVNVHKFRCEARIVQRVLALQDAAAESYDYQPEPSVYFRALKIRSLDSHIMHEVSKKLEP